MRLPLCILKITNFTLTVKSVVNFAMTVVVSVFNSAGDFWFFWSSKKTEVKKGSLAFPVILLTNFFVKKKLAGSDRDLNKRLTPFALW